MMRTSALAALSIAAVLALAACAALKPQEGLSYRHPVELEKGRPTCTECHKKDVKDVSVKNMNHTVFWLEEHRFQAYQRERLCQICHYQKFCNDCHETNRIELKPSLRYQTDTYRRFPHPGDYRSRHFLDAEVDPTSCVRCHGNPKASKTCNPCHGRFVR